MATKCIVLGEAFLIESKKPIEFTWLMLKKNILEPSNRPGSYRNIEIICTDYEDNEDLMFAYDQHRSNGCLYLGHWNDGVIG